MGHFHPLTWMSLAIDFSWSRYDAAGYRVVNLLWHGINTGLLYLLARVVLSSTKIGQTATEVRLNMAALTSALCFAWHPMRVETVAWITERRDLLAAFFLLLSLLAWWRFLKRGSTPSETRAGFPIFNAWYTLAWIAHFLSLNSKAWGITFPLILWSFDLWPGRKTVPTNGYNCSSKWGPWLGLVWEKLPFLATAVLYAMLAGLAQREAAAVSLQDHGMGARLLQGLCGLGYYLGQTVAARPLDPLHLAPWQTGVERMPGIGQLAPWIAVAVAGMALLLHLVRRYSLARLAPLVVAALFYAFMLLPVLGFAQSGPQWVADRYSYLALWPWAAGLGWMMLTAGHSRCRWLAWCGLAGCGLAAGWRTADYADVWRSDFSLWKYTWERNPENGVAGSNYALASIETGRPREAGFLIDRILPRADRNPSIQACLEELITNRHLIETYLSTKPPSPGINPPPTDFSTDQTQPLRTADAAPPIDDITCLLAESQTALVNRQPRLAARLLSVAAQLGGVGERWLALAAITAGELGHPAEAVRLWTAALAKNPGDPNLLFNRGLARAVMGSAMLARQDWLAAMQSAPPDWPLRAQGEELLRP